MTEGGKEGEKGDGEIGERGSGLSHQSKSTKICPVIEGTHKRATATAISSADFGTSWFCRLSDANQLAD